jgi:protein TonB
MTHKVCILLVLCAALCLGLGAQSTNVTIGGTKIEITQPENSGPPLTQAEIKEHDIFGSDDLTVWAIYAHPEGLTKIFNSKSMPSVPNPLFFVFSLAALNSMTLDTEDLQMVAENFATSLADGMSEALDDPNDPVSVSFFGEFWNSDFGQGFAINITSTKSSKSALWLLSTILVKGKILCLNVMQNYIDTASQELLQATTSDWAEQIYVANGGTLSTLEDKYVQDLAELGKFPSANPSDTDANFEDRSVEFVPYEDPPEIIGNLTPVYPDFAKRARVQGTVVLEVEVYADGVVGEIKVTRSVQSGPGGLDEAAIDAVRRIRFKPGREKGKPVNTTVIIPIEFKL